VDVVVWVVVVPEEKKLEELGDGPSVLEELVCWLGISRDSVSTKKVVNEDLAIYNAQAWTFELPYCEHRAYDSSDLRSKCAKNKQCSLRLD